MQTDATPTRATADALVFIFLAGGLSHLDAFDPKPDAPREIRGPFGVTKTNTGELLGAGLPRLAAMADKYSLIRSMTHDDPIHARAAHRMMTGTAPAPAQSARDEKAADALTACNGHAISATLADGTRASIPTGPMALQGESTGTRDGYGFHPFGQRLQHARRLIEAGTRVVTVVDNGWDHHRDIHKGLTIALPQLDQGAAALLADLDDRGLLARTLVVIATEFGRTPLVNPEGGRDHWPHAFSILIAGGGIPGGVIHGRTDRRGAEVVDAPVTPADLAGAIYRRLGAEQGCDEDYNRNSQLGPPTA